MAWPHWTGCRRDRGLTGRAAAGSWDGRDPLGSRSSTRTGLLGPLVLLGLLAACAPAAPVAETANGDRSPEPTIQTDDVVDLTVFFRHGAGQDAVLAAVTREVPVEPNLPERAVRLLVAGPQPEDGDLEPPLPTTTEVRDVRVEDQTAHVDLSAEVIRDADQVGATPRHEALALAALADTLTEFPEIDQVRLSVEGQTSGTLDGVGNVAAFWGGWGLPTVLVRDDSLVDPDGDGDTLPDLDWFAAASQTVGSWEAGPVDVQGVRTRDRTSYLRIVVELADARDEDATAAVPPARAWTRDEHIILEVRDVVGYHHQPARIDPADPTFADVDAELDAQRLRVLVRPREQREFALHTQTSPVRVVLDVRK